MYLTCKKWKNEWDKGLTLKLFIEFLKQHKCVHNLYGYLSSHGHYTSGYNLFTLDNFSYPIYSNVGRMFIKYGKNTIQCEKNGAVPVKKDLILSQFWKFYVLERLDKYPKDARRGIRVYLREQLENNGVRGNQELEQLFEKYQIKIKF